MSGWHGETVVLTHIVVSIGWTAKYDARLCKVSDHVKLPPASYVSHSGVNCEECLSRFVAEKLMQSEIK